MGKFLLLPIITILLVLMLGVGVVFAGTSILGKSEVQAGKTYTYTVKISVEGIFMMGNVKGAGVFSASDEQFNVGKGSASNESLSETIILTVKVASDARPGDKGKIYLSDATYSYYDDNNDIKVADLSISKTAVVVAVAVTEAEPAKTPKLTPEIKEDEITDSGSIEIEPPKEDKITINEAKPTTTPSAIIEIEPTQEVLHEKEDYSKPDSTIVIIVIVLGAVLVAMIVIMIILLKKGFLKAESSCNQEETIE